MATIKQRRGDDLRLRAVFTEGTPAVAYDMSGWVVEASMQAGICTPVQLTVEWLDQPAGIAYLLLTEAETLDLTVGEYEIQIRATSPEGFSSSSGATKVIVRD